MENKPRSLNSNALYFGVLTGLALIIFSLVLYIFNQQGNQELGYLNMVFLAVGMFFTAKSYRDNAQDGFISYGRALGVSVLTAFYASVLLAIYLYVFFAYIDPEAIKPILEAAESEMYKQGMEGQELDNAMEMTRKFMKPGLMAGMAVLSNTFWGTIISLITSIFVRREQKI
jgi:predicted membrane protein